MSTTSTISATNEGLLMANALRDLCRVCLQLPHLEERVNLNIIYDEEENLSYSDCFTICTQIDLSEGDNLPHNLCTSCGLILETCYDFHKKIEESKRTLEEYKKEITEDAAHYHDNFDEEPDRDIMEVSEVMSPHRESIQFVEADDNKPKANDFQHETETENDFEHDDLISGSQNSEVLVMLEMNRACEDVEDSPNNRDIQHTEVDCSDEVAEQDNEDYLMLDEQIENNVYHSIERLEDEENYMQTEAKTQQINTVDDDIEPNLFNNMEYNEIYTTLKEENGKLEQKRLKKDKDETQTQTIIQSEKVSTSLKNEMDNGPIETKLLLKDKGLFETKSLLKPKIIEEENQQQQSLQIKSQELPRKSNKNVIAVSNKEHLPQEPDNTMHSSDDIFESKILLTTGELDIVENAQTQTAVSAIQMPRKRRVGSYSCEYCCKIFPNYSRMANHRKCHESDRPRFSCDFCNRMYATKQGMESHIQTEHEKTGYPCSVCNKVFAIRRSLEVHMRFHNGVFPFHCDLCDKKFAQLCHLNTHKNVRHDNVRFACGYENCGKFFTSSSSLRNHEYSHGAMPFECELCDRGYPAKAKLKSHIKRKHGLELSEDRLESMRKFHVIRSKVNLVQVVPADKDSSSNNINPSSIATADLKVQNPSTHHHSEESISISLLLKPHEKQTTSFNSPPFICELCDHESPSKALLASHRHRKHRLQKKPITCHKCNKTFFNQQRLDKHLQRPYCQPYPKFKCDICSKLIAGYGNYQIHLRFHNKEYSYGCQECGKGFMLATHLRQHIETEHEHKRFICENSECKKQFRSINGLKSHMYVHMDSLPYRCDYCDKMFSNKASLKYHIRKVHDIIHTSEELHHMLVGKEISLKANAKSVE